MKTNRFAFNAISLMIAGLCFLAALSTLMVVLPSAPANQHSWWYFMVAIEGVAALTLGLGGGANLAKGRRLAPLPTGFMIVGYLVTVWLLPLALWGIISLILEHKHHRKQSESSQRAGASNPQNAASVPSSASTLKS